MPQCTLDTSGLTCPLPILKARKALAVMESDAILEVLATDPAAPNDFIAFCKATGHTLLGCGTREDGLFWFHIRRGATV
jgi:tRNA 2-thiouridine synthesizing protein A